jgi:DNA helicase TIP49 (TBP-interacting protein)
MRKSDIRDEIRKKINLEIYRESENLKATKCSGVLFS